MGNVVCFCWEDKEELKPESKSLLKGNNDVSNPNDLQ